MAPPWDFFISYANDDADPAWAQWIADTLEKVGHSCRLQAWDIGVGSNFVVQMDEFSRRATRLIMVLSPSYLGDRPMVKAEWTAKFVEDADGKSRLLLPVMVRRCDVTGLLGPRVYLDLVDKSEDEARQLLLDAIRLDRGKPDSVKFPGSR
ncbi:toll/interleukin-1 receptor domain-containing protein [Nocardia sp. NPDC003482]